MIKSTFQAIQANVQIWQILSTILINEFIDYQIKYKLNRTFISKKTKAKHICLNLFFNKKLKYTLLLKFHFKMKSMKFDFFPPFCNNFWRHFEKSHFGKSHFVTLQGLNQHCIFIATNDTCYTLFQITIQLQRQWAFKIL